MAKTGLFYARFMDDWVVLAPIRWALRAAIKCVNETLVALRVSKHPDKTFVGRITHGFTFLGYTLSPRGLGIATQTLARGIERLTQLYEQGASSRRVESYVRRWCQWALSGFSGLPVVYTHLKVCIALMRGVVVEMLAMGAAQRAKAE